MSVPAPYAAVSRDTATHRGPWLTRVLSGKGKGLGKGGAGRGRAREPPKQDPACSLRKHGSAAGRQRIGKRVRAREGARRRPALPAPVGTIEKRWGAPGYPALDVLLEDSTLRLFWHHELEEEVDARNA